MTKTLPRLRRDWNGAHLFIRSLQAQPRLNIARQTQKTARGNSFDLYARRDNPVKTIIAVYGMGLLAENDPRLNKFTQACMELNARVIVPHLPGLKSFRLESRDLEILVDLLAHVHAQYQQKISIIGFSAGASITLSACADPALADKISSVVVFGPLHDIREVWQTLHSQNVSAGLDDKLLEEALWTQYVIAFRNRDKLGLSADENTAIEDALRRWSFDLPLAEKFSFHQKIIAPLNLTARHDLLMENDSFDILSPRGKLHRVQARVSILHDARDSVVPPAHGQRILDELGNDGKHKLLVTPLLSHVTIHAGRYILDTLRIMNFLGELYA